MSRFIVKCRVSGGVTGTREAPLKNLGAVVYFHTLESAKAEADRLNASMANHTRATFRYWPEPFLERDAKHSVDRFGFRCSLCDARVHELEEEGLTTSDAQGVALAEHREANEEALA
jgi:hypothetical protein